MSGRLARKAVILTGGASGIGMAIARGFLREGAAAVQLSRLMEAGLSRDRSRLSTLRPGTIDTPLYRNSPARQADPASVNVMVQAMCPLGIGSPDAIAHAAVYLAPDESRCTTGAPMPVDDGARAI